VKKIRGRSAKKTGRGKGIAERRRMSERSGSLSKGGLCHRCETTTAQELDEDVFATLISFF